MSALSALKRTALRVFSNVNQGFWKEKEKKAEERGPVASGHQKEQQSKWTMAMQSQCLSVLLDLMEFNDLGSCRRIFCQNRSCKWLMIGNGPALSSRWIRKQLWTKAVFMTFQPCDLCFAHTCQDWGRAGELACGQMGSLGLYLFILGHDLHFSNPHAQLALRQSITVVIKRAHSFVCDCIYILPIQTLATKYP